MTFVQYNGNRTTSYMFNYCFRLKYGNSLYNNNIVVGDYDVNINKNFIALEFTME